MFNVLPKRGLKTCSPEGIGAL